MFKVLSFFTFKKPMFYDVNVSINDIYVVFLSLKKMEKIGRNVWNQQCQEDMKNMEDMGLDRTKWGVSGVAYV